MVDGVFLLLRYLLFGWLAGCAVGWWIGQLFHFSLVERHRERGREREREERGREGAGAGEGIPSNNSLDSQPAELKKLLKTSLKKQVPFFQRFRRL